MDDQSIDQRAQQQYQHDWLRQLTGERLAGQPTRRTMPTDAFANVPPTYHNGPLLAVEVTRDNVDTLGEALSLATMRPPEMDSDGWCSGDPRIVVAEDSGSLGRPGRPAVHALIGDRIVEFPDGTLMVFTARQWRALAIKPLPQRDLPESTINGTLFYAHVTDAGGKTVHLMVTDDTKAYPEAGVMVQVQTLTADERTQIENRTKAAAVDQSIEDIRRRVESVLSGISGDADAVVRLNDAIHAEMAKVIG